MVYRKRYDKDTYLLIQDIMDILYKLNRIKYKSYDPEYRRHISDLHPIDKVENIVGFLAQNSNYADKQKTDLLINLLRDINSVQNNVSSIRGNEHKSKKDEGRHVSKYNMDNNYSNNVIDKIIFFLKSLNDDE